MIRTVPMLCAALLLASPVRAQTKDKPSGKQTAQQERMKSCNAQASQKELKGDERKAFMSQCLKADSGETRELTAQQRKMKSCNVQADKKDLKGDQRREFISDCLSA